MLLVVAGVVIGARLLSHRAVDVDLELGLGARAPELRAVNLIFTDEHEHVERELSLTFPGGASARERRRVRLHQGAYTVGARLEFAAGPPVALGRPLRVDDAGTYALELAP